MAPQIPNFVKGMKSGGRGVVVTAKEWVGKLFKSMADKFSKEADDFARYVDKVFGEAAEETIENGSTSGGKWIDDLAESGSNLADDLIRSIDDLSNGWTKHTNNGFTHIYDDAGNLRVRVDIPDSKTPYKHIHIYDEAGNSLDVNGNVVPRNSSEAHIPYD